MHKYILALLLGAIAYGQQASDPTQITSTFSTELLWGNTLGPSDTFPELSKTKALFMHFGNVTTYNKQEWAHRLSYPTTGVSFGYTDFGNMENVGYAISAMPYLEFSLFGSNRLKGFTGFGISSISEKQNPKTNPLNDAISTDLTWTFRLFLTYTIYQSKQISWKIGGGYSHHSNGHSRLPNLGLNSLLATTSVEIGYNNFSNVTLEKATVNFKKTRQNYFQIRGGLGQHVLSEDFNKKREVFSIALSMGRIYNKTWKFGFGTYARYYEHYYRYISNEERLIQEVYPEFKEHPVLNAMAFGIFGSTEILLNHVGLEWQIGFNIFKPAYKIDRQEGQSYTFQTVNASGPIEVFGYGELDEDYKRKQYMSNRFGLKYYLKGTNKSPIWNLFLGATLNANAGQADFNELSAGVVYRGVSREKVD